MAYFIGPNTVECTPIRKTTTSASPSDCSASATAPTPMKPISATFTHRAMAALSSASDSDPATPENNMNGKMNTPVATVASVAAPTGSPARN